jgi:predicted ATPase
MGSGGEIPSSAGIFVGREFELAELRAGLEQAFAGRGGFFLISGEPGIGKTRLSNELAAHATSLGAKVMWGRCWQGPGAPAYWPWIQIIRTCVGASGSGGLNALLASDHGEVSELLPEIAQRRRSSPVVARLRAMPSADAEEARFRLFDSAARLLIDAAGAQPLMLILDDLHDADQPTLLMLRFVARELGAARILAIGTYRDTEVRRSPALGKLIGDLGRESRPIPLAGFGADEVAQFVAGHSGIPPSAELVSRLHRATAGNPFFLDGIVRLLRANRALDVSLPQALANLRIPAGVRESVRARLAALSPQTCDLLAIASVIGLEFDFDFLQRVSEQDTDSVLNSLDEAEHEGIIAAADNLAGSCRFSQGLIGETLYDDIPTASRARIHRHVGQTLEEYYEGNLDPHVTKLAHHYRKAAPLGEADKAIDYSIRAGEAALAVFAPDEAIAHWQAAMELLERQAQTEERRADLQLRLAIAMVSVDWVKARDYAQKAIQLFENLHQAQGSATAHLVAGSLLSLAGVHMDLPRAIDHYREAAARLEGSARDLATGLSALVDCGLADAAHRAMRTTEGLAAARRAMESARQLGDDGVLPVPRSYWRPICLTPVSWRMRSHCSTAYGKSQTAQVTLWPLMGSLGPPVVCVPPPMNIAKPECGLSASCRGRAAIRLSGAPLYAGCSDKPCYTQARWMRRCHCCGSHRRASPTWPTG